MTNAQTITQVSVFLENRSGSLEELLCATGNAGINILALCIADTTDFGIARMIVKSSDTQPLLALLRENGSMANTCEVVCVALPNTTGSLSAALKSFTAGDVSIEYAYSFCRSTSEDAQIIMKVSDTDRCLALLNEQGIKVVAQNEVDSL